MSAVKVVHLENDKSFFILEAHEPRFQTKNKWAVFVMYGKKNTVGRKDLLTFDSKKEALGFIAKKSAPKSHSKVTKS